MAESSASINAKTTTAVGLITDAAFIGHDTGPRHPERPDRLRAVFQALRRAGMVSESTLPDAFAAGELPLDLDVLDSARDPHVPPLAVLPYRPATDEQLLRCHTQSHLERVRSLCEAGGVLDAGDTPVCAASERLARGAAGAAISAVDAVLDGVVRRCFVAARPPGHHAEPDRAMGFCLFSNVALAARHAVHARGLDRVAVIDFDVHHGNGTQACIEADPSVLFISLHQHPQTCYPGTGFEWEIGIGPGKGYTLNVPLPPGSGDSDYRRAMIERVLPRLSAFAPQLILCSAGFDAHADDPLADMELTDAGFSDIARLIATASLDDAGGRVVSVMEGGYNLSALARNVVGHIRELQAV